MILRISKKGLLIWSIVVLILIAAGLYWLSNPQFIEYEGIQMKPSLDIADNIHSSSETSKFESLLTMAGFDTFLHDRGPFTVFAPVDAGYAKLLPDFTDSLTDPEQPGKLRQLLLYHIVKGTYHASDLKDGMELTTLEGEKLKIVKSGQYWLINGYSYIQTYDINTKNGVIHTVDSFLIPPSMLQ